MPLELGGEVGGARSTSTSPIPPPAKTAATAGVAVLKVWVQLCPPLVDWRMPLPLTPAYNVRLAADEVASRVSDRASPPPLVPGVQFRPPSVERNKPLVA